MLPVQPGRRQGLGAGFPRPPRPLLRRRCLRQGLIEYAPLHAWWTAIVQDVQERRQQVNGATRQGAHLALLKGWSVGYAHVMQLILTQAAMCPATHRHMR